MDIYDRIEALSDDELDRNVSLKRDELSELFVSPRKKLFVCDDTESLAGCFSPLFDCADRDKFALACFDGELRLLDVREISRQLSDGESTELLESGAVTAMACTKGCAFACLAHCHTSGSLNPSENDIRITRQAAELLRVRGVRLIDHLVFGDGGVYSMREAGRLAV